MNSTPRSQLGPVLLSGLMIGPILGSGIIILPPLAFTIAGDWAIAAWAGIALAGLGFAIVFGRLSILHPGPSGVAAAVEQAFGRRVKILTSVYLAGAVLFGPVAVMLTAADYLLPGSNYAGLIGSAILIICAALLFRDIQNIGRIGLVLSTASAVTLTAGSIFTLLTAEHTPLFPQQPFNGSTFGYCLLLLFWTIVGWEVIGNYSGEIRNPRTTIPKAVRFSAIVIALVSLSVAAAVQYAPSSPGTVPGQMTNVLQPLAGKMSTTIMGLLTLALCTTTYLMFVGGVARLVASLANEGILPGFLGKNNSTGAPKGAILSLTGVHLLLLILAQLHLVNVEKLVSFADGFFLANAAIGLAAAFRLLHSVMVRATILLLGIFFLAVFLHASIYIIGAVLTLAILFCSPVLPAFLNPGEPPNKELVP